MKRVLAAVLLVMLFSGNGFTLTMIQRYMMLPNSITNEVWGFSVMVA